MMITCQLLLIVIFHTNSWFFNQAMNHGEIEMNFPHIPENESLSQAFQQLNVNSPKLIYAIEKMLSFEEAFNFFPLIRYNQIVSEERGLPYFSNDLSQDIRMYDLIRFPCRYVYPLEAPFAIGKMKFRNSMLGFMVNHPSCKISASLYSNEHVKMGSLHQDILYQKYQDQSHLMKSHLSKLDFSSYNYMTFEYSFNYNQMEKSMANQLNYILGLELTAYSNSVRCEYYLMTSSRTISIESLFMIRTLSSNIPWLA